MKKIKGSLSKPEPTAIIAAAAISLCVLLPLRVYQVTALIDPETGFFKESNITVPLFYILCAVVIAAVAALSFLNDKANRTRDLKTKSVPLGILSALTALSVMFDSVFQMAEFMRINSEYPPFSEFSQFQYLSKSGAVLMLLQAVFGILTAFVFCIYTFFAFGKKSRFRGFSVLTVTPVAWAICRIIVRFVRKISFVNISDLLLELCMLVFLIMFLLSFAQVVTKVTPEITAWRLYGCGIPAALLCFLIAVPRLFLMVIGHSDALVANHGFSPCDLALALFIPVFLYNTATVKKQEN